MPDDFNEYKLLLLRMAEDGVKGIKELTKALADHEKEADKRMDKLEQDMVEIKTKVLIYASGIAVAVGVVIKIAFKIFGG